MVLTIFSHGVCEKIRKSLTKDYKITHTKTLKNLQGIFRHKTQNS
ncbi:MAG: hypothetical protein VB038_04090 [Methanobrevibacter sp.]|nr:hypothetical protein [Methanobrevibacter sp.]MEA4956885.1 hypothetical protein [Methanobrevibacter sp.]